ncbi:hypothetical protein [Clostridium saccharoperbutylacetonicum]|uniref:hypothetical protein n=1 Tax=Clostridium saccharoperbutylacetonicum TaxID=36745 RepID=UPI0039E7F48B
MRLIMHVLKRSKKLGIDNETLTFKQISDKLKEEFYEVIKAINNYNHNKTLLNLKEIIRETFDVIQICILIMWRCNRIAKDLDLSELIEEINIEHKDKLISERGWEPVTGISVEVKE